MSQTGVQNNIFVFMDLGLQSLLVFFYKNFLWFDLRRWFDPRVTSTWSWIERLYLQFVWLWRILKMRLDQGLWKLDLDRTWTTSDVTWWEFFDFCGGWIGTCIWCLLILHELDEKLGYLSVWPCREFLPSCLFRNNWTEYLTGHNML